MKEMGISLEMGCGFSLSLRDVEIGGVFFSQSALFPGKQLIITQSRAEIRPFPRIKLFI